MSGPGWTLLHDGRQSRQQRRQPVLGIRPGRPSAGKGLLHLVQLGRHRVFGIQAHRQRDPLNRCARENIVVGNERGLSMTGFLFTTIVIVVVALVAFRVGPSYIEYFTVQKALDTTMQEVETPTAAEIRRSMDRRLSADYVDAVNAGDVLVGREGNSIVATLAWQKILHMVGNASILLEFEARSTRG